jgi:hypothetical protein
MPKTRVSRGIEIKASPNPAKLWVKIAKKTIPKTANHISISP